MGKDFEDWKEANSLPYKWQFKTLDGDVFFGPRHDAAQWHLNPDYPIRYFLWKTNRDAWRAIEDWRLSEGVVMQLLQAYTDKLGGFPLTVAENSSEDEIDTDAETMIEVRVAELDEDELLVDFFDEEWISGVREEMGHNVDLDMMPPMLSLLHVTEGARLLAVGEIAMAGAYAIKAESWLLFGRYVRGKPMIEWNERRRLAMSGADVAHAENRRLRQEAIDMYLAKKTWPSMMQAARAISAQVNRTELVVARWIREYRRHAKR